jgi:L-methionine (R)-S-oxide reductase
VIVDDVSPAPRYLACSLETRSEIVVPIQLNGKIVGEIDIDSHTRNALLDPKTAAFWKSARR